MCTTPCSGTSRPRGPCEPSRGSWRTHAVSGPLRHAHGAHPEEGNRRVPPPPERVVWAIHPLCRAEPGPERPADLSRDDTDDGGDNSDGGDDVALQGRRGASSGRRKVSGRRRTATATPRSSHNTSWRPPSFGGASCARPQGVALLFGSSDKRKEVAQYRRAATVHGVGVQSGGPQALRGPRREPRWLLSTPRFAGVGSRGGVPKGNA